MRQQGILGNWALNSLTAQEIEKATDDLIKNAQAEYEKVENLRPEEVNFENCIQVINNFTHILLEGNLGSVFRATLLCRL